jgi:hypothetical protein
VCDDGT